MKKELSELLKNSYCPYSNFPVAAIVVMKDGSIFKGVNVENAAYGSSLCAERVAIFTAVANGYKKGDFKEIYIINKTLDIAMPCFSCRQVMSEFFDKTTKVISMNCKFEKFTKKFRELAPYPFEF